MSPTPPPPPHTSSPSDLKQARLRKLHASGQAVLYDVLRRVRAGYCWWATGSITTGKVLGFVTKMAAQYGTDQDSLQRHRQKAAGEASSVLFVWPLRNDSAGYTQRFGWLLLSTEHLDGEVMYDGTRKPVKVSLYANGNSEFHLIPKHGTPRSGAAFRSPAATGKVAKRSGHRGETVSYTWQLSAKSRDLMQSRFAQAAGTPAALTALRRGYAALPMVAGYRLQFREVLVATRILRKRIHTPSARVAAQAIRTGEHTDPLRSSDIPFIAGFPPLYSQPPLTLGAYLEGNEATRRKLAQRAAQTVSADHDPGGV